MAHFVRTHTDGDWNTLYAAAGVPATKFADIDSKIKRALNGVDGGCWVPTNIIQIDGSGLKITGPLVVWGEGTLTTESSARIKLGDGDWPTYGPNHVGRTRSILTPCIIGHALPKGAVTPYLARNAIQFHACTFIDSDGVIQTGKLFVPLRVHNGGTIANATVHFRVGKVHARVPIVPRARVVRVDKTGAKTALSSTAVGADSSGYVPFTPAPTSASEWYAGGAAKSFSVPCDQNNIVDKTLYTYWAEILEESGIEEIPFQVQIKADAEVISLGDTMNDEATIDGVFCPDGTRVLQIGGPSDSYGIWVVKASADWERASDCDTPDKLQQGCIFNVKRGAGSAGTTLRQNAPTPNVLAMNAALTDDGDPILPINTANPQTYPVAGNIWQAVVIDHVKIADTRFQ